MARHYVVLSLGLLVEAENREEAAKKATSPLELGLLPHMVGLVVNGARLADEGDTPEAFAKRWRDMDVPRDVRLLNETERKVYDHYMEGSTRGDLHVYVKRGGQNVMKPDRENGNALAAWYAGRDLAAKEKRDA